jgi:hypothetical protein
MFPLTRIHHCFLACLPLIACLVGVSAQPEQTRPFVLDMVFHNPGEPETPSKFLDPALLREWGFDGNIPRLFIQCAVTFESIDPHLFAVDDPARIWIDANAAKAARLIAAMGAAGLPCYPFTDFIVLPKALLVKNRADICDPQGRVDISRPRTKEILRAQIDEMFRRFPDIGGLTIRHGETYLHDTPFHTGGNPILRGPDSHVELLRLLREEVCVKRGKKLFYRTWDFGQMHDRPDYYLNVTNRIEPHQLLYFSIKYQLGDFHRLSRFNPCLGIGRHPQIVEVQCQMEAYGKGAFSYYTAQGAIEGWEEYASHPKPHGIRDLVGTPNFAGVWTWSRGGGWGGPHLPDELWCELNTYVVAKWAQNPTRSEEDIFNQFAREIAGLRHPADLARFRRLAVLSAAAVLRSQNSLIHKLDVWWNRDDFFGDLRPELKNIAAAHQTDAFLGEKAESVAMWREIETLASELTFSDPRRTEFVHVSSTYGRIKAEIIEQACRALLLSFASTDVPSADPRVTAAIARYDELWSEWRKLKADHPDACPSLYSDKAFENRPGLGAAINSLRK